MQSTDTLAPARAESAAQPDPYGDVQVLDPETDESHIVRGLD